MKLRIEESKKPRNIKKESVSQNGITYRVWYNPYSYPEEEDYIDITGRTEKEARESAATLGYVTGVETIEGSISEDVSVSLKEREYVDDTYIVSSKESMNMEDNLRGIYVDDSLDVLEDELSAEGFEYYEEGQCIEPKDCGYRVWVNGTFKVYIYYGLDDNIVYNIYVKENGSIRESSNNVIKNESIRKRKLREQDVEIKVKHEGILEVPEGKTVDQLPMSHFEKLVKKHGLPKITKALNNLQVWNKNDDKKLSKWAGNMIDKLTKKYGKNESVSRKKFNEGWHNGDATIAFPHNDDLEADLEEFLFDLFSDNPDVFEFDWSGKTTILYLDCSEDDYKYIKWFIKDWKYKHRDEYDEYDESLEYDRYDPNVEARFMDIGDSYSDVPDTYSTPDDVFDTYVSRCMIYCKNEKDARKYLKSENLPESFIDSVIEEVYRRFEENMD